MSTPNCEACPLRAHWVRAGSWTPVSTLNNKEKSGIILVGDAPRKDDMLYATPFVGTDGIWLTEYLQKLGYKRTDVSWTYAVNCRFPNDKPKPFLATLEKRNRARARKGEMPHPTPQVCCRPRLRGDLEGHTAVLTMGDIATKEVLPGNPSLMRVRGGPTYCADQKVLPTVSYRFTQLVPSYRKVMSSDIKKGLRFFSNKLRWKDPEVIYHPAPEELEKIIQQWAARKTTVAYDVETTHDDSLVAGLRCIGLGTAKKVVIVGFEGIDPDKKFYPAKTMERIKDIFRAFFLNKNICKVGHNAGVFDRIVVEQHLGITPTPLVDTILLHHLAQVEYPHGLGFIGSVLTDAPAWKADHTGVTARTDEELHEYCATDVSITHRIAKPLLKAARRRSQAHLYPLAEKLQRLAVGMHRMGMRVDERRRSYHEQRHIVLAQKHLDVIRTFGDLNPNSHSQVRELLFEQWALPPQALTSTGEPSTDAPSLRALLNNTLVDEDHRVFLEALRRYRKSRKLLDTYLTKLRPGGIVRDGYVHADYNTTGTVSGRYSSSKPNFQNIPYDIRDIFIPPPGCVFVGADYDQLELRLCAAIAGLKLYLKSFNEGLIDPHSLTAEMMFGKDIWEVQGAPEDRTKKGKGEFKQIRDTAKTICFLSLYGGRAPKVHENLVGTEDAEGNLPYSGYTSREVRSLHRTWHNKVPELKRWWESCKKQYRQTKYIEEPVLRRRRYFHEEDYNALINYGVQAGGFSIVAMGMVDLVENWVPFDFKARTGLVNQLHDAVLLSVPESEADRIKKITETTLTRNIEGLDVVFTTEAHIGNNWKEV